MTTDENSHGISDEVAAALRSAAAAYYERFPSGSIPKEIEDSLVTVIPDLGEYYLFRVYYPAPKGQNGFPLFETRINKRTAICNITLCRDIDEIPPELIAYDGKDDPV